MPVDPHRAGGAGAIEVDAVAFALLGGGMERDEGERLHAAAQLLPDLADRGPFGRLERPDAAAGEHEQSGVAVAVPDQRAARRPR